MANKMKKIIEKMVKEEIREILAENEDTVKEIVKKSLVPELRIAIRESIPGVLEDLLKESLEMGVPGQAVNNTVPQQTEEVQDPEPASNKNSSNRTPDFGRQASDIGSTNGRYLYCIAEGDERINIGNIGIQGNKVYTISYKDLSAVVHDCHAEPYQSEDQDTVEGWVVAHQRVIDAAWERFGTVLPMGFDTIIRGNAAADPEENMRDWLDEDYENLKGKIEKIRGKVECGVQVFWDSRVMAKKITEECDAIKKLDEKIKTKPKGLAYMYRQKLEDLLKNEMENQADRYFKDFHERIKQYVDDLRVDKTKKAEDENKQMLMNLSCLLPKDGRKRLGDELEKIDALEGFSVRFTGPWPPYSFV